jgi:DNA-binding IclR family transcriptional regulator
MAMTEPKRARTGADSARRVLDVLFAFSEDQPVLSVKEIAEVTSLPLPSAHRYVALLREEGLMVEGERGRYHLTPRVTSLGRAARAANSVIDVAEPHLRRLVDAIGETVLLARIVQGVPVCIHRVEAPRRLRLSFEPGQSLPPLRGASVKVLVASMGNAERAAYLDRVVADRPDLAGSRAEFENEIALAADRGWATSTQEIDEGVWAVAAAITDGDHIVASLSAACPSFRLDAERKTNILDQVRRTADAISRAVTG